MTPADLTPPHCDPAILHAPGECQFCDDLPEWQALRQLWGICFTGHEPIIINGPMYAYELIACPSDIRRPAGSIWSGNRADPGE